MSRWDKIKLSSEDCQFIWNWFSEKNIKRADIDTFPPVFNKWEIELRLKSHDLWQDEITKEQAELLDRFDKEIYGDKYEDIQLNIRCRVLSEERNIVRFNMSLYRAGKTIDKMSYTVGIVVLRTYDDILKEKQFIEDCKDGKGEFSITQAGLESFDSFHFEEAVELGALLNIPKERTIETIEKQMLPAIFLAECGSSRKNDDKDNSAAQLKDLAMNLYINVSLFLAYFKPEVSKYSTRETAKDVCDNQPKKAKAPKKKKKQGDVYSVINISKYITDIKDGHEKLPRRKCPYAYKVRGHFRHYKSGKKVWISEFTKNTEEKRKARTMKLSGVKKHQKQK